MCVPRWQRGLMRQARDLFYREVGKGSNPFLGALMNKNKVENMQKCKNFSYEIVRNIFTIIIIVLVLYFSREYSIINFDYLLLFVLILIGTISYFSIPMLHKKIVKKLEK